MDGFILGIEAEGMITKLEYHRNEETWTLMDVTNGWVGSAESHMGSWIIVAGINTCDICSWFSLHKDTMTHCRVLL
jgi:hypothetical protein